MKRTYEEILRTMVEKYKALSGNNPDDASDIGIRLQVLAGEIYAVQSRVSYLNDQLFPQTAAGEYLEMHCEERGIYRKPATKAVGQLKFMRSVPLSYDLVIPAGTVCSADASAQYITTEQTTIYEGMLSTVAAAEAMLGGKEFNCGINVVNTLVTVPEGVESVTNSTAFTGGWDTEDDDRLRARLLAAYKALPNGVNGEYYRRAALAHNGVNSVGVKPMVNGVGTVGVYLWGVNEPVNQSVIDEVQSDLSGKREINVTVTVASAQPYNYSSYIYVTPVNGCQFTVARDSVKVAVEKYFSLLGVGDSVYKADLGKYIMENCPIKNCAFPSAISDFRGDMGKIAVLASNNVSEIS